MGFHGSVKRSNDSQPSMGLPSCAGSKRGRAATGRCEGRKPFGMLPGEAELLARMQGLRAQGWTFERIAAELADEGIATRIAGGRWFGSTVAKILRRTAGQ